MYLAWRESLDSYSIIDNQLRENKARNKRNRYYDAVSYKVVIEYGTKAIPIAQKLGELEAKELLEQISALTGFSYPNR